MNDKTLASATEDISERMDDRATTIEMKKALRLCAKQLADGEKPVFLFVQFSPHGDGQVAIDVFNNELGARGLSAAVFDVLDLLQQQAMREIQTAHCEICKKELGAILLRAQASRQVFGQLEAARCRGGK